MMIFVENSGRRSTTSLMKGRLNAVRNAIYYCGEAHNATINQCNYCIVYCRTIVCTRV